MIDNFNKHYSNVLNGNAKKFITDFINDNEQRFNLDFKQSQGISIKSALSHLIPVLSNLGANVTYCFNNDQTRICKTVEVAFAHLQRKIIAIPYYGKLWKDAQNKGEMRFEQLDGEHLLVHKIWASKVHSSKERTDLVLKEPINDDSLFESVAGLILTEWKCADEKNYSDKIEEAEKQVSLYESGSLYPHELVSTRYLVIISEKRLKISNPKYEKRNVTYRVINIAYSPDNPSVESRKKTG